jgi:DNA-binding IclR family transcriptional regulator
MLTRAGSMSPAQVAKQTGLPPSNVEPILERLIQLKYVNRKSGHYTAEARPRPS